MAVGLKKVVIVVFDMTINETFRRKADEKKRNI